MEKGKLMMIIIIALLVLLLGTIGAVSFIVFSRLGQMNAGSETPNEASASAEVVETPLKAADIKTVPLTSPITTNLLKGQDGNEHLIRVDISLGVNNTDKKLSPTTIQMFIDKEPIVRDICNTIIRNTTYEEILSSDGEEALKETIRTKLSEEFDTNLLVAIYFQNIVLP